jgi:hypothetical protein
MAFALTVGSVTLTVHPESAVADGGSGANGCPITAQNRLLIRQGNIVLLMMIAERINDHREI